MRKLAIQWLLSGSIFFWGAGAFADSPPPTLFSFYGFIKAGFILSTRAVDSAGNTNLSIPNVVHPDISPEDSDFRSSFQVAQSRFGLWIQKENYPVKGQFELDFLDPKKSTPTVASLPRLRIAKIVYRASNEHEWTLGQDWDPFSPFRPFSNGMIGILFQTGNVGFMRQQIKWQYKQGDYTSAIALVFSGVNDSTTVGPFELGVTPGVSHQSSFQITPTSRVGFSIMSNLPKLNSMSAQYYGVNTFWNWKTSDFPELRLMTYYGQNLGSIGSLGLGTDKNHEVGGYLSFGGSFSKTWVYSGGAGIAHVMNSNGSAMNYLKDHRILNNAKLDLSLGYHLTDNFKIFGEYVCILSHFRQKSTQESNLFTSHIFDVGGRLDF